MFTKTKIDILQFGAIAKDCRNCHGVDIIIVINSSRKVARGTCCCVFDRKRMMIRNVGRCMCLCGVGDQTIGAGTVVVKQKKNPAKYTKKSVEQQGKVCGSVTSAIHSEEPEREE